MFPIERRNFPYYRLLLWFESTGIRVGDKICWIRLRKSCIEEWKATPVIRVPVFESCVHRVCPSSHLPFRMLPFLKKSRICFSCWKWSSPSRYGQTRQVPLRVLLPCTRFHDVNLWIQNTCNSIWVKIRKDKGWEPESLLCKWSSWILIGTCW